MHLGCGQKTHIHPKTQKTLPSFFPGSRVKTRYQTMSIVEQASHKNSVFSKQRIIKFRTQCIYKQNSIFILSGCQPNPVLKRFQTRHRAGFRKTFGGGNVYGEELLTNLSKISKLHKNQTFVVLLVTTVIQVNTSQCCGRRVLTYVGRLVLSTMVPTPRLGLQLHQHNSHW